MSEILAPCGGYESLSAALNCGADAVYVGMKRFSARKNAENFSDEELAQACRECHRRGVKLYVALNTIVYDEELPLVAECIRAAAECGVDGLILQDLGAAAAARQMCPEMPRHASTQMSLNSVSGVRAAEQCGYSRVVLGRELSFEQIKRISQNTAAELEVFVHGALCVCISGQCYMSSIFGGRSGNRGLCAQPCRLDFTCGGRHNVLSLKDSGLIEHIDELEALGIASYKIEGRMKRPEYVACASDACRKRLDGREYDRERLAAIFSRGGLTDGYFTGEMRDMQGIRGKDDVENSTKALSGIRALYKDELPRLRADIHVTARLGEPLHAQARCGGICVSAGGERVTQAQNAPVTSQAVCARMAKLGGTQFFAGEITADADESIFVSAAALNALRRSLCEALDSAVAGHNTPQYSCAEYVPTAVAQRTGGGMKYRAEVACKEQLEKALELDFELIYAPLSLLDADTAHKERIAVIPPLVLADCEDEVREKLLSLKKAGFTKGMAQTLGHAQLLKECGFAVHGGYRMNIANSAAAQFCGDFGFEDITLSFEASAAQLSRISCPMPRGIFAYGRLPLMALRRCPVSDGKPCGRKTPCGECITDRRGKKLPVLCGGNSVELLNPDTLIMSDKPQTLAQFDFALLRFTTEQEPAEILEMYKRCGKPSGELTRGLYFRGAE